MKKLLALALAIILALSLAACGGNSGNSGNNNGNNNTPSASPANSPSGDPSGGNNSTSSPSGNDTGLETGAMEMSVTVPDGWREEELLGTGKRYVYSDYNVAINTLINLYTEELSPNQTAREFAEKWLNNDKKTRESWEPVFTGIADVTVSKYNALAYDVVTAIGQLSKVYVVVEGSYAYIIQCATMTEYWEVVGDDFQTMIDSFTLK